MANGTSCGKHQKHYSQTSGAQHGNKGLGCTAIMFGLIAGAAFLGIASLFIH